MYFCARLTAWFGLVSPHTVRAAPPVPLSGIIGPLYSVIQRYRCRRWVGFQPGNIGPLYLGVPVVPERRGFPVFMDHSSRLSDKRVPDSPFSVYLFVCLLLTTWVVSCVFRQIKISKNKNKLYMWFIMFIHFKLVKLFSRWQAAVQLLWKIGAMRNN